MKGDKRMNVKDIVKEWLKDRGYDGLLCEEIGCACNVDKKDFMECDEPGLIHCNPGIIRVVNTLGDSLIIPYKESLESRKD